LATQVVRSNVFSARRRAPTVRYRDPLAAPSPELADIPTAGADGLAAGGAGGTGADEGPRLLGIASVAGVWQALVQWTPGRPAVWCAVAARCVDGDGGGRVRAIAPDAVDLVVAGRVRTLRLAPRRATDSLSRVP
jgi:hypothetical protein